MEPFIGEIRSFPYNFAPKDWVPCEGQLLSIRDFMALFSLVGNTFGGDGRTTFGVPDLRGSAAMNQGTGPGLSNRRYGKKGGAKTAQLSLTSFPLHSHTVSNVKVNEACSSAPADAKTPVDGIEAASAESGDPPRFMNPAGTTTMKEDIIAVSGSTDSAGTGQGHDNQMPFQAIGYFMATEGLYPPRS